MERHVRRWIGLAPLVRRRIDSALCRLSPSGDKYKTIQINDLMATSGILSLFGDETAVPAIPAIQAIYLK